MKQIEATILGQSYKLACPPDGETLLRDAVVIVDREMCAIRDAGKMKARERIAVLTALNLAYQQVEQTLAARAAAAGAVTTSAPATAPADAGPREHAPDTPPMAQAGAATEAANDEAGQLNVPVADPVRIAAMIRRIDMALNDDGLLI